MSKLSRKHKKAKQKSKAQNFIRKILDLELTLRINIVLQERKVG